MTTSGKRKVALISSRINMRNDCPVFALALDLALDLAIDLSFDLALDLAIDLSFDLSLLFIGQPLFQPEQRLCYEHNQYD